MSISRLCSWWVVLIVATMAMFSGGCGSSPPPISVSVSPSSQQAIDQTQTVGITAAVSNDSSGQGVSWSLTGPGSLTNATTSSVTYNSPTTSLTTTQLATVTATSIKDTTKKASVPINVNPYPQIPFQTLSGGSAGVAYSQMIAVSGGTAPFQWSVYNGPIITGSYVGGSVPDGLTLNANTGVVSGTPTGGGTWFFEAVATDAAGVTVDNGFLNIQINPSGPAGNPVPYLNAPLVPAAVSPGSPGFTLNVHGTGFVSGSTINLNRAPLATTFVNAEHLTATVPAASIANAGTAAVAVVSPAPGGGASNVVNLQVHAPESIVNFTPATSAALKVEEPFGMAAGDFNGDGKADLVVAANVRVYVFLGNGDGTFVQASGSPIPAPSPPYDDFPSPYVGPVATGDFNNSGQLGFAVGEFQSQAAVILLGKGDGTFVPSSATFANAFGMPMSALAIADFNADGNLDLVIANGISPSASVSLGYGKGAFTPVSDLTVTGFPAGLAVGDFNADGKLDVAVVGGGSTAFPDSGVTVSLGNGDGTFTPASGSPILLGNNLSASVTGDFNGDGKLDLAMTDSGGNAVLILPGNGDGTFGSPVTIPVGNNPDALVAGDFNSDGKLDLAVANFADGTVTLLLGNGDGTFTQAAGSPYTVGKGPYQIVAADFNGDGKLDLAVANLTDGTVVLLLQQ